MFAVTVKVIKLVNMFATVKRQPQVRLPLFHVYILVGITSCSGQGRSPQR